MFKSWIIIKLQVQTSLLQSPAIGIFVISLLAIVSYLGFGVLWPAAAVLSSILTTHLNERPRDNYQQTATSEEQHMDMDSSSDAKLDGHAPSKTASQSQDIGEGSTGNEETNLDRVDVFLTRSEGADWGFAWDVGAHAAKRLIVVNIYASSPIWLWNGSRQADGLPTIAVGDELVCVESHSDFDALERTLASATSAQFSFLRAHAVQAITITRRKHKTRISTECEPEVAAGGEILKRCNEFREGMQQNQCSYKLSHESSKPVVDQAMPSVSFFESVMKTKNTFIDFSAANTDCTDRFAKTDPIEMRIMYPLVSKMMGSIEDANKMQLGDATQDDEITFSSSASTIDTQEHEESSLEPTQDSINDNFGFGDHSTTASDFSHHYDTMDLGDFFRDERNHCGDVEESQTSSQPCCVGAAREMQPSHIDMSSLEESTQDSFNEVFGIYEFPTTPSEFSHHYDAMDLQAFFRDMVKETESCCVDAVQKAQPSHIDVANTAVVLPEVHCKKQKNPISLENLLSDEPIGVDTFTCRPPYEFSKQGNRGELISSADTFTFNVQSESTRNMRSYANNHASEVLRTQPCLAIPCEVPSTELWGANQQQIVGTFAALSHQKTFAASISQSSNGSCRYIRSSTSSTEPMGLNLEHAASSSSSDSGESTIASVSENFDARPRQNFIKCGEDWYCPTCFDLQFQANDRCRMCGLPRKHGVTDLQHLDAGKFLEGHCVTAPAELQFRNLTPELQQTVMSGGSLHGARDPTAVLYKRMKMALALASKVNKASQHNGGLSRKPAPIKLSFDKKKNRPGSMSLHPVGIHSR